MLERAEPVGAYPQREKLESPLGYKMAVQKRLSWIYHCRSKGIALGVEDIGDVPKDQLDGAFRSEWVGKDAENPNSPMNRFGKFWEGRGSDPKIDMKRLSTLTELFNEVFPELASPDSATSH